MTDSVALGPREYQGLQIPAAGTYTLDTHHKRVGFVARHMMVAKVRGHFETAEATIVVGEDPLQSSVTASIQTATVSTSSTDRDNHLRSGDFFESEKYPEMIFRSTSLRSWHNGEFVLDGELTIKDVTKPVELKVEFEGATVSPYGQDVFGFSATAEVDREEWGLTWNMILETGGVGVSKKIKIEIEGEAIRQP